MASTHTISRAVRETVHSISIGRTPLWGEDTLFQCHNIGLVDITGRLTPAGEAVARSEDERILAAKRSSRLKRAARHEAMTSVGMKRTPYGYE